MISNSKEKNEKLLKGIMPHLIRLTFVTFSLANKVAFMFSQFADNEFVTNKDNFMQFDRSCERLDHFCYDDKLKLQKLLKLAFYFKVYVNGNSSVQSR